MPPLCGFLLALALNQPILGRVVLRAIFYLPVIVAPIAVATIWRWMYDPFFGLFNQLFTGGFFHLEVRDGPRSLTQKIYVLSGKTLRITAAMMHQEPLP